MAVALTYALGAFLYFFSRTKDEILRKNSDYIEGAGTWYAKYGIGDKTWEEGMVIS